MKKLLHWTRTPSYLVFAALALAALVCLAANSLKLWLFTADDSFITFRYSAHLVRGIGPTFNEALPRAEGYTSVLWMLVMAIPHVLGFGVVSFSKLVGILAMIGTMACMALFVWQAGEPEGRPYRVVSAGLVILFFGLLPETAVHAVSGMETAGYTFLLTGLATLAYLSLEQPRVQSGQSAAGVARRARNWLPLAALLCGLMRPEGNLIAALLIAAVFLKTASGDRKSFALRVIFFYILPGLVYFLWRWSYFRLLLPLPFYIKSGGGALVGWEAVSSFGLFLLGNLGLYLGLGLLGERRAAGLVLLVVLPDLFFFLFSYPIMDYDYRYGYPLLPLILALAGMGLALLLEHAHRWRQAHVAGPAKPALTWLAPAWLAFLALVVFAGQNLPRSEWLIANKRDYALGMLRNHVAIGQILNQARHGKTSPVLVVTDAGAMPYFSGWNTIDAGGLNDPQIAAGRVKLVDYVFSSSPDVLVLTSNNLKEFANDGPEARDLYWKALEHGLEVVVRSPFYQGDAIFILARPGSEAAGLLKAKFEKK